LHAERFVIGERAALRSVNYRPTHETTDDHFPFLLTTGRTLYQFNAGTMTMRTPNAELRGADTVDISVDDAARLGVKDGSRVRIRSRWGETVLSVRISGAMEPGEVFATFHSREVFLNRVTSPHRDSHVKTPEYKVTAVRIDPVQ
jgi:formate dehydrogenase major subunit